MQDFRNYYELLGVTRDASPEDIKKSFRRLARQYHPDLNPGDKVAEEKFKDISEAYDILSDVSKRAQYDQFTKSWRKKRGGQADGFWGNNWNSDRHNKPDEDLGDFSTFIDQLLGRKKDTRPPEKSNYQRTESEPDSYRSPPNSQTKYNNPPSTPKNIEAELTLPLEKAYAGGRERIKLEDGRTLEVDMPPGMTPGQKIRLRGQGIAGGDLFLKINISPNHLFRLDGNDIYCYLPVTPAEAVLGGFVEVPTLDGLVKISLPQGVANNQRLRLAGKGFPNEQGKRGDQLLEIQIVVPKNPSIPERELYQQLKAIETFNPRLDLPTI
jgi:curved DNA-binding protein